MMQCGKTYLKLCATLLFLLFLKDICVSLALHPPVQISPLVEASKCQKPQVAITLAKSIFY